MITRGVARILVLVALIAATAAWTGFIVEHTVGDTARGPRIAEAIVADDAARGELAVPIADAVIRSSGIDPAQRDVVVAAVDQSLLDPAGSAAFVAPFSEGWAAVLAGKAPPASARFDVSALAATLQVAVPASVVEVPGAPVPSEQVGWLGGVRRVLAAMMWWSALLATMLLVVAFGLGQRAYTLRRFGVWAIVSGVLWVAAVPVSGWVARRVLPGFTNVARVAATEATRGIVPAAAVLAVVGVVAVASSFFVGAPAPARQRAGPVRNRRAAPVPRRAVAPVARPVQQPVGQPVAPTQTMPVVTRERPAPPVARSDDVDDPDSLWEFYS